MIGFGMNYDWIANSSCILSYWIVNQGTAGFYKGFVANAMKVVPNNGLRFMAFEFLRDVIMKNKSGGGGD